MWDAVKLVCKRDQQGWEAHRREETGDCMRGNDYRKEWKSNGACVCKKREVVNLRLEESCRIQTGVFLKKLNQLSWSDVGQPQQHVATYHF